MLRPFHIRKGFHVKFQWISKILQGMVFLIWKCVTGSWQNVQECPSFSKCFTAHLISCQSWNILIPPESAKETDPRCQESKSYSAFHSRSCLCHREWFAFWILLEVWNPFHPGFCNHCFENTNTEDLGSPLSEESPFNLFPTQVHWPYSHSFSKAKFTKFSKNEIVSISSPEYDLKSVLRISNFSQHLLGAKDPQQTQQDLAASISCSARNRPQF